MYPSNITEDMSSQINGNITHLNTLSFLKKLTQNDQIWNGYLIKAMDYMRINGICNINQNFLTSCAVNFCALLIIFNGLERASEYMKTLTFKTLFRTSLGKKIYIYNLGSEHAVLKANKEYAKNPDFKFTPEYGYEAKKLKKYWENLKNEIYLGKSDKAQSSQLDASSDVIKAMVDEIENNEKIVNDIYSFVYQAVITAPTKNFEDVLTQEDLIHKSWLAIYHCFIIEQFKSPNEGIRYFLYQSWINKFTLAKNLESKSYEAKSSWSKLELNQFFDNLHVLLSQYKNCGDKNLISEAEKKCFDVKNDSTSSALCVNLFLPALSGKSLRYITSKISLDKCEENFNLFATTILKKIN